MHGTIFSTCRRTLGSKTWGRVLAVLEEGASPQSFPDLIASLHRSMDLPAYLADLARLEWLVHGVRSAKPIRPSRPQALTVNPTLVAAALGWSGLPELMQSPESDAEPRNVPTHVLIWKAPQTSTLHYREARSIDLLALKLVVERIDPRAAAIPGQATPGDLQNAIDQAVNQGMLLSPGSRIRRSPGPPGPSDPRFEAFHSSDLFTLQWHITQTCDLHCKHCYDRSERTPLAKDAALAILEDFYEFCRRMQVRGQVTFTGGNPLLYPHIEPVYRAAADLGFGIAVLGNPGPIDPIRRLMEIAPPLFFQISLEGMAAHNDEIRGPGHFKRSCTFLERLRELGIFSMVMLTLTRDNIDQVLPLAEFLRDRTDAFNFNRLSTVGEGAKLKMPEPAVFESFLKAYLKAAAHNPIMGLKDNLINILHHEKGREPFGGCTGYGCGAAFNFVALLPDGEVHACRKFPSLIGNINEAGLFDIYHGPAAQSYRNGARECGSCQLNPVCRGCLAVTHSLGLEVTVDKDPFCFLSPRPDHPSSSVTLDDDS